METSLQEPLPDAEFLYPETSHLRQLNRWLGFQVKTGYLFFLAFFFLGFVYALLFFAAVVFSPFMLWKLYRAGRYNWIGYFFLFVVGPWLLADQAYSLVSQYLLSYGSLAIFYLYTWSLKVATSGWIETEVSRELLDYWDRRADEKKHDGAEPIRRGGLDPSAMHPGV